VDIRQVQGHELAGAQAGADRELDERVERAGVHSRPGWARVDAG
jgi:hypothetical protein